MKKITFYLFLLTYTQAYFAQETIVYYDDFNFATNSGFTSYITSNPGNVAEGTLIKRVAAVPSEVELGYTRPVKNIPRNDDRVLKSVNLIGSQGSNNFEADLWLVTEAIDISNLSNLTLSFASRNRFFEGPNKPSVKMMVATNYTDGTDPSTVSWTDITATIQDSKETFYNDGKWALSYVDLSTYITETESDKFAVAFKLEYKNTGAVVSTGEIADRNRNGNWNFSDFKFVENSTLSTKDNFLSTGINVYPNPVSDIINIQNNNNLSLKTISINNILGQTVLKASFTNSINVTSLKRGIYIMSIVDTNNNRRFVKKIVIK